MASSAINALNSLLRGTGIEDHDEVLELADAALEGIDNAEKLTVLHTKVVALLNVNRFDDALRTIAAAGDSLAARCVLEHAYALYKSGDLHAAETLCHKATASRGLRHVAAQAAYRAERFDRAAELYASLGSREGTDAGFAAMGEATDMRINTLAVAAQSAWQHHHQSTAHGDTITERREDFEAFETAYNAGCAALARNDVARGLVLLQRAQQLCSASEELSDEDKRTELFPILIQQTYALTRLGRIDEAIALQEALVNIGTPYDVSAQVVAATNGVVLRNRSNSKTYNPYIVQRDIEAIPAPPVGNDRLFAHQGRILRRNQYTIELQCYRFKGVRIRTAQKLRKAVLEDAQSSEENNESKSDKGTTVDVERIDLGVFHAAAKAELQTGKEALRKIVPLLAQRPDDVGLLLTAVQLHLQGGSSITRTKEESAVDEGSMNREPGNADAALSLLEAYFKHCSSSSSPATRHVRYVPGLVALVVGLYKLQGRFNAARSELANAMTYWQSQPHESQQTQKDSPPPVSLLRAAGIEMLRSPNLADQTIAASAFEALHGENPTDRVAIAGLVASLGSSSVAAAAAVPSSSQPSSSMEEYAARQQQLAKSLTPVDQLVQGVDVESLLQSGVATLTTHPTAVAKQSKKRSTAPTVEGINTVVSKKAKTVSTAATGAPTKLSRQARKLEAKMAVAVAESGTMTNSFDPAKKPDPERWLPLRDRSSYRPPKGKKGRRRGAEAQGTVQGAVGKEEETLALAGGAGSVRVEKAPQGGASGSGAKKRKKGKK